MPIPRELCGRCNHEYDHVGEQCSAMVTRPVSKEELQALGLQADTETKTERCKCPGSVRTDAHANHQLARLMQLQEQQLRMTAQLIDEIHSLGVILLAATGLEVDQESGELRPARGGIVTPFSR